MTMTDLDERTTVRTPEYQSRTQPVSAATSGPDFEGLDYAALILIVCMALGPLAAYAIGFGAGA
jgi:hypothetical protein